MVRKEIVQILALLAGNYDSFAKKTETDEQVETLINLWQDFLGDLDYKLVLQAVKKLIISSPYSPTINDIRKVAINIMNPVKSNTLELWDECYKMICKGTYMTQEEFDQHSEICKKFLGSTSQLRNYARTDIGTINTVVKGQFMKQCDLLIQQEKENRLIPEKMKKVIGQLSTSLNMKQITS